MFNRVLGCIITYNPVMVKLEENIKQILNQVDRLLIIDNNSSCIEYFRLLDNEKINIILNKSNEGISKNYNYALNYAKKNKYEWLLTMDQDTLLPNDLMRKYYKAYKVLNKENIISITPQFFDINLKENITTISSRYCEYVDKCISTANLIKVKEIVEIGGFDEFYFIDYVDFDISRNIINNNYKIIRVNDVQVNHAVGNSKIVRFLGKSQIIYNHPPIRSYYMFRNGLYYSRKFHLPKEKKELVKRFILILFFEKNRIKKICYIIKGVLDSKKHGGIYRD